MRKRWLAMAVVAAPGLVLSAVGITHPILLNAATAAWWTSMHYLLLPLFPLLGVAIWILLRHDTTTVGWGGRVAAIIYTVFYGGLDAVSGIAAGTVTLAGADPTSELVTRLFAAGRPLGYIGGFAFFVAVILVLASAWRNGSRGSLFYSAAAVALVSGYLLASSHIYWPKGGLAMLGFAVSFAALELVRSRREAAAPVR